MSLQGSRKAHMGDSDQMDVGKRRASCQALKGRGSAEAGAQEYCLAWAAEERAVVGQEGRPWEAGGTGSRGKSSGGNQESERPVPGLKIEEKGDVKWMQD